MADTTKISWTDSTFNPWIGCTRIGPGCDACYAAVLDARHKWGGAAHWGAGVPRYRTNPSNWQGPRKWNRAARATGGIWRVFCASLADVFDNEAPDAWREDLFALIRETPALTWQLVTKRIGNAKRMLPRDWGMGYPNVWLISTIVNQEEAERDLPRLLEIPARVHGVSYEPAVGPVDWSPWLALGLGWIIIGGESAQPGHEARPFDLGWARSTICQFRTAGAHPFMKQLGSCVRLSRTEALRLPLKDRWFAESALSDVGLGRPLQRAGADPAEWPVDLRIREFPLT